MVYGHWAATEMRGLVVRRCHRRPLWIALQQHHQAVAPKLGPFVPDEPSWNVIRELLAKSAEDGLLFEASDGVTPVGLASAAIHDRGMMPALSDIWATGDRTAETKFRIVDASRRGSGIGSALLDEVDAELLLRDVRDQVIGASRGNARSIRFYESRGFRPCWVEYLKTLG